MRARSRNKSRRLTAFLGSRVGRSLTAGETPLCLTRGRSGSGPGPPPRVTALSGGEAAHRSVARLPGITARDQ